VLVLAGVVLVLAALALCVGGYPIAPDDVVRALVGEGQGRDDFVIDRLRLPRLALGVGVGVAFALSGALFQAVLDNPLASPDILGISGGATVVAVYALLVLGLSGLAVSAAAFLGAAVVAVLIYALAWRSGITGNRFVLVGIAFAFMANGALGYLLTRSDIREAQAAYVWMVGSIGSARWDEVRVVVACLALLVPAAVLAVTRLRALQLGDDTAVALGVRAEPVRLTVIVIAAALAAVGTAAAGPVAFVAFVSAPIARRLVGTGSLALLPSALVGAAVVVLSDFVGQHLLPGDVQVPVGVVTGAIGAPYLLWLLASSGREGRLR
jgi:iron complex transport system permease protein